MKSFIFVGILFSVSILSAQQPKELEFNTLPCTSVGAITSDGRTCEKKDVDKYIKSGEKILTNEEKNIVRLSKKKDPLNQKQATNKKSKSTMMGNSNFPFGGN